MRGAIAAGHPRTAEAGAQVLADGGNAVDACLAAAFVSWVAESPLTGPGGGGFLLVHRARDGRSRLLDFFVSIPGAELGAAIKDMDTVDVDFDSSTTQTFGIGAASVAVPGVVAGLEAAHRAYGRVPWARLFEPAIALAREGIVVTPEQAYLHAILDVILRHTEQGREIYGPAGAPLGDGDRFVMNDFASTLELLADQGAEAFYDGALGDRIAAHIRSEGGALTREDLRRYRVIWRRPVAVDFLGGRFVSNPPPSTGGVLIAYGLLLLDRVGLGGPPGSADAMSRIVGVLDEQAIAGGPGFASQLHGGGLARQLHDDRRVAAAAARLAESRPPATAREPAEPSRTTHISVVDAAGNAASLTASTGAGSGVVVPGTGIHLNNMLGEHHLNLARRRRQPGGRLTSMMAPSLLLSDGRPRLVVGSAGSSRLRGAILQIVVNVVGHGLPVDEAIDAPRVHLEAGNVHCEGGADAGEVDELERGGYQVVRWRRRNLYFGGAAAVEFRPDGALAAAGDPGRGGHGIVVGA